MLLFRKLCRDLFFSTFQVFGHDFPAKNVESDEEFETKHGIINKEAYLTNVFILSEPKIHNFSNITLA